MVFILFLSQLSIAAPNIKATQGGPYSDHLKGGWLEIQDGVRIIHLNGSYYDMGYQLGILLKDDYLVSRRAWLSCLNVSFEDMMVLWDFVKDRMPQKYKDEIQGRADALGLTFNETATMEVLELAVHGHIKCSHFAAWESATEDGKLYHFRSCDGSLNVKDPMTGKYASDDQVIIVRKPYEGYASVVIGPCMEVGTDGGFNEYGISTSYSSVITPDISTSGLSSGIRRRMLLEQARTLEQAIDIYSKNATVGWNEIISDGKNSTAVAIEQSANYNRVCNWNGSFENRCPSQIIDHVIRRGNFFLDPVSAGFKEDVYKKSGFFRYILYGLGFKTDYFYFCRIMHYKVMSKAIGKNWGSLNLSNIMNMMRSVYQGKTSISYNIMQKTIGEYSKTWFQSVVCPETGELLISFSNGEKTAFLNPIHHFNYYELINAVPS